MLSTANLSYNNQKLRAIPANTSIQSVPTANGYSRFSMSSLHNARRFSVTQPSGVTGFLSTQERSSGQAERFIIIQAVGGSGDIGSGGAKPPPKTISDKFPEVPPPSSGGWSWMKVLAAGSAVTLTVAFFYNTVVNSKAPYLSSQVKERGSNVQKESRGIVSAATHKVEEGVHKVGERASNVGSAIKREAQGASESVGSAIHKAEDKARKVAEDTASAVKEKVTDGKSVADTAKDQFNKGKKGENERKKKDNKDGNVVNGVKGAAFSIGKALHIVGDSVEDTAKKVEVKAAEFKEEDTKDTKDRRKLYVILGSTALGVALAGTAVGLSVMDNLRTSDKGEGPKGPKKSKKDAEAGPGSTIKSQDKGIKPSSLGTTSAMSSAGERAKLAQEPAAAAATKPSATT
ncbi:hypothetical protein CEUSTIGMA_g3532.t1 [Chlamydomonas eustigma]|uniref:Uncharacterized protein n=1 Tax=Chlamydomonas eustigma TaxID=1157962 RepID=A0A250WZG7_9CHLO|nr:hypothetical protein CEUSTIGMA_g3532.t1 [Chlamydomonas eustigma]|eukprot:GAX76089.1 hypothetical protein CEUSTIGMA_g3532.t1 [Chlamydomonas eustigma]